MLSLQIMKNHSPVNKIGKDLSDAQTFSFVFKDMSSILDPVIVIRTSVDLSVYNYLYIQDLQRYYFIKDIKTLHCNEWEISAHVDVLQTYQNSILANTGVIRRQAELYNTYLLDPEWKTYAYETIHTFKMPANGFSKALNFVLATAGA